MREINVCEAGERIQKTTFKKSFWMSIGIALLVFVLGIIIAVSVDAIKKANSTEYITYENYSKIEEGMTYRAVVNILDGHEGTYGVERDWLFVTIEREYYKWSGKDKSITIYVDSNNRVTDKNEYNLIPNPAVEIYEGFVCLLAAESVFFIALLMFINKSKKEREELNNKATKIMLDSGFNITNRFSFKELMGASIEEHNKFIVVDNINKQIGWVDYKNENIIITNFDEILNYEIYENGGVVTNGAGITGGLLGKSILLSTSSFRTTSQETCNELRLIVRLKSREKSQIAYDIVVDRPFNIGLSKNSKVYQQLRVSLQETVSFLEVILEDNKKPMEIFVVNNNQ